MKCKLHYDSLIVEDSLKVSVIRTLCKLIKKKPFSFKVVVRAMTSIKRQKFFNDTCKTAKIFWTIFVCIELVTLVNYRTIKSIRRNYNRCGIKIKAIEFESGEIWNVNEELNSTGDNILPSLHLLSTENALAIQPFQWPATSSLPHQLDRLLTNKDGWPASSNFLKN